MKYPNQEEIVCMTRVFDKLIDSFSQERRTQVVKMMSGAVGQEYMTAPASGREDYHNAFPGGLLAHSLNVVQNLKKIGDALCKGRYGDETMIFVGLFHDLGKAGDGARPAFVPNESEWSRKKGFLYETNKECLFMPHAERSLYLLQANKVEMSAEEYLAIRLHDGPVIESNRAYSMREPELALLLNWADMWSVTQEKAISRD